MGPNEIPRQTLSRFQIHSSTMFFLPRRNASKAAVKDHAGSYAPYLNG